MSLTNIWKKLRKHLLKKLPGNLYLSLVRTLKFFITQIAVLKLRRSVKNIKGIDSAIDFAFSFDLLGIHIRPAQLKLEVEALLRIIEKAKPSVVLEVGTAAGGTLFLFSRIADPKAVIISLDLPAGYPVWRIPLYKAFATSKQHIYLVRGDSHDPATLERVKMILSGKNIDFLFIDGDHSYEGVRKDFEIYSQFVRKRGLIAFHDIIPDYATRFGIKTRAWSGQTYKLWDEIKQRYRHLEIVSNYDQDGAGIGVIFWDGETYPYALRRSRMD